MPLVSIADQDAASLLNQAQSRKDPAERIEMLDEALKNQALSGKLLSSIFFARGMAHKELKDCFKAVEDFSSALGHSPGSMAALLEKAECLITVDQLEEASRTLEAVLLTGPGTARAYVLKGMIYEREGFLTRAHDEYTRALNYEPESALALEMRAKVLLKEGKPRKALEDLTSLIRLRPKDAEFFLLRAQVHVKLEDYGAALTDFAQVDVLRPADDRVRKERVLVYFKTRQPQKALDALSKPASAQTEDSEILILRARAHIALKNYREAESILASVLAKEPLNATAHLYSGVIGSRRQDVDTALMNFNRAIELDPALVEAYKERARTFMELKEPVRAAADLSTAVDLDPSDGEIFALRGLSLLGRHLYDAAIADFTRALDDIPGDTRILYDRAATYLLRDEAAPALADLDALLKIKPRSARAVALRGVAQFYLGNIKEAREDLDRAASMNPKDPQILNNRGFFLYKTGDIKGAVESFRDALKLDPNHGSARYNMQMAVSSEELASSGLSSAPPVDSSAKPATR